MTKRYVQLNRTFLDYPEDHESDPDTLRAIAELTGTRTDWDTLLQSRCVIVLGEAGSGKTTEFREKARSLQQANKPASFCAIEDLADEGLEAALPDPSDVERFLAWLSSEDQGIFFLDSIDEMRLKGHSLDKALRKLRHTLGGNLHRSRFAISCRVSDWQAEADRDTIESIVPAGSNEKQLFKYPHDPNHQRTPQSLRVVQLAPLSREQIQKLAQAQGLNETDGFLQAIGQADAWRFAERPRDVEWLVDYWKANNRLGTLTELIRENINNKLRESNLKRQPKDPLAPIEALSGAATLAAAATLCKKSSFILPDGAIEPDRTPNSLDPHQVLSHWPQEKTNALLTRAVFDEATYGRVRFHHRSVTEYLTALWLTGLLEKGCPRPAVEEMLFKERYGCHVIVPSMAPVTAWLAGWDDGIRKKLLKAAPEVLIQYGDPQAIPVAERHELLRTYAQLYSDRKRTYHRFDWTMVRRFAHKDLASTINDLLGHYRAQSDIRILLLELVEYGQLAECATRALAVALDEKEEQDLRLQAIQAVTATGSLREMNRLKKYVLSEKGSLPNRLLGTICEGLFPVYLDLHELLHAARQARPQSPLTSRLLPYQFERIVQKCPSDWLLALAQGFLHLVGRRAVTETKEDRAPSFRYAWLIDPMCKLVARILDELPAQDTLPEALLSTIEFLYVLRGKESGHHSVFKGLDEKVAKAPQIRRVLFWRHVKDQRSKGKETVMYLWELRLGDLTGWSGIVADDLDWLIADISEKQDLLDRLLALDTALTSWHTAGRPRADLKRICLAVGNDPKLNNPRL
ncbi:MAG: ATP-binding protein [Deltaproteobacteria bacterium]|nr:ATP-binding protein [Deltaproteobacteria bacterium]